jgi:tetratricopeptide (TPR) repeat protein
LDEATSELQRAQELDPLSSEIRFQAAWPSYYAHRYEETIGMLQALREMDPKYSETSTLLGETYEQQRKFKEAETALGRAIEESSNAGWALSALGRVYGSEGKKAEAQAVLARLQERAKSHYVTPYGVATIYASLGETDRAFEYMSRACQERCEDMILLLVDPRVQPLRTDDRFQELLRCAGFSSGAAPGPAADTRR